MQSNRSKLLFLFSLILALSACVSGTDIPVDHYYRLPPVSIKTVSDSPYSKALLYVNSVQVSGLLNDRNLLYTLADKQFEVKKYFYHQWADNPSEMLRDHLLNYLKSAAAFSEIKVFNYQANSGYLLNSRLERMEINYTATGAELKVSINFEVLNPDRSVRHSKLYNKSVKRSDRDIYQLVTGYSAVLEEIYSELMHDLYQL